MDWLSDKNFFFVSSVSESKDDNFLIQVILIIAAAFLGAFASYIFSQREAKRVRKTKLNSLAISTLRKLSTAHSASHSFASSFFYNINATTKQADYWLNVKSMPQLESNMPDLNDDEFEFLLDSDDDGAIAHKFSELINAVNINTTTLNTYAHYKQTLNSMLAQKPNLINSTGSLNLAIIRQHHPEIAIKIYETNDLCIQAYNANLSAIQLGNLVITKVNAILPKITENPNFSRRLVIDDI